MDISIKKRPNGNYFLMYKNQPVLIVATFKEAKKIQLKIKERLNIGFNLFPQHQLKINPSSFIDVVNGIKKAELRKNNRLFQVGQVIQLNEFDGQKLTGSFIQVKITHILQDSIHIPDDLAMLSIENLNHILIDHDRTSS